MAGADGEFVSVLAVVKRLTRGSMLLLGYGFALIVIVLIAHSAGLDLAHMVSPFLHPRDQANLPLVAAGLQSHFSIVLVWLALLAFAVGWYFWGFKREQWMWVFAALTVLLSSSLYFTNALFHPILANERTYRPFMLGTRSTVQDAPLYFYKDAYDYGLFFMLAAIFLCIPTSLLILPILLSSLAKITCPHPCICSCGSRLEWSGDTGVAPA